MVRILWLCTHRTQWREEVPLLLEAGFEVIPAKLGHPEYPVNEQPDDPYYVKSWRRRCTLPPDEIDRLRAVNWFCEAPPDMVGLANEAFDAVIVTSFFDTLTRVGRWFTKPILFRLFGLAGMGCYTEVFGQAGLKELPESEAYRNNRYYWCPILATLRHAEHPILTRNEVVLEPFVSPERLSARWQAENRKPYVALVLSRVAQTSYYGNIYSRITSRFRSGQPPIPMRILGQNQQGALGDEEIVGSLPDEEYFKMLARATAMFYQGDSICHLHWSVLEALAMGVPVVMLHQGYLAWLLREIVGPRAQEPGYGIVEGLDEARSLLQQCLDDREAAANIAYRQQPLAAYITDRDRAARQIQKRLGAILGLATYESGQDTFQFRQSA